MNLFGQMGVSGCASAPVASIRRVPISFSGFLCALILATSTTSIPSAAKVAQAAAQGPQNETTQERDERKKHPSIEAPERMAIEKVNQNVPVATPLHLTLTMAPGKLVNFNLTGPNYVGPIYVTEFGPSGEAVVGQGTGPAKIVSDDGTTKVIEVMPAQIGRVTFRISALYSDNADVTQTVQVNVYPVAKSLKSFSLGVGKRLNLALDGEKHGEKWLRPSLLYPGLVVDPDDAEAIKLTVDQPEDDPVIRLEKTGLIHPLRPGKATIIGDIEGVQDRVEVTVYATKDEVPKLVRTTP